MEWRGGVVGWWGGGVEWWGGVVGVDSVGVVWGERIGIRIMIAKLESQVIA